MIIISTKGMTDGKHEIVMTVSPEEAENLPGEFAGDIHIKGTLTKFGKRYNFTGNVICKAILICDRSLEEFEEIIKNELKWTCLEDSGVFREKLDEEYVPGELYAMEEKSEIDITREVTGQLTVAIPMKKIAPEYRDKEIDDIYPGHSSGKENEDKTIDSRWEELKKIKFN